MVAPPEQHDIIIIGAGFAGLYALHRARDVLGLDAVVLEAGSGVGGTWYWNRYPGARCDSESWYYCYSFSPELLRDWRWSSRYPEQPEILRYLEHVADRFDLRRDIWLDQQVVRAEFDEVDDTWLVTTSTGDRLRSRYLISAVGCLSATNIPAIEGVEAFAGPCYHTARWPHDGVDFAGRRVGLIGTGSTGIQATPVIAAAAEHLTVFQRTPNYSVPARDRPLRDDEVAAIKADYDAIWRRARRSFAGFPYEMTSRSALAVGDEERRAVYEALWQEGGFRFLWGSFHDLLLDEAANQTAASFIAEKIRATVQDPVVAEALIPTDHPYGAKRPPIDTGYYEAFNRPNVTLVDLRQTPITRITPDGVATTDGQHELDVLVFATGFDAVTGAIAAIDIRGRHGLTLRDRWAEGPRTYLGLQTAGFPNLFFVTGPQSPSVLANMPVAIEQHVEWITDCIDDLRRAGASTIEATDPAEAEWVEHTASLAASTLFAKASSWYLGANVPGKRRVFLPYVGGLPGYRDRCSAVRDAGYEGFEISGRTAAPILEVG